MANFITDNTPLPPPKTNDPLHPPTGNPAEYTAEDVNPIWQALGDSRAAILGAQANIAALQAAPPPAASIPPRRTAPDASDQIVWTLDEAGAPWASSGALTGVAYNLAVNGTTQPLIRLGLFANGTVLGNGINPVPQGGATVEGASTAEWPNWSVSLWILPRAYAAKIIICKSYRPSGSFATPFYSFSTEYADAGGAIESTLVVGGVRNIITTTEHPALNQWNYLGYTYDGAVLRIYRNGEQVYSQNIAGPIDYGTHGPWILGNQPVGGAQNAIDAVFDEVRIANVVRPASYFAAVWKQGMML